jgi:hypothetical protein
LFSGCVGGPLSPPSELSAIIGEIVLEISSSPGIHIYSPRVNSTPGTVHLGIIYPWYRNVQYGGMYVQDMDMEWIWKVLINDFLSFVI